MGSVGGWVFVVDVTRGSIIIKRLGFILANTKRKGEGELFSRLGSLLDGCDNMYRSFSSNNLTPAEKSTMKKKY